MMAQRVPRMCRSVAPDNRPAPGGQGHPQADIEDCRSNGVSTPGRSFKIYLQATVPDRSPRSGQDRKAGVLTVGSDRADFQPEDGPSVAIENVRWVARGYSPPTARFRSPR